MRKGGEYLTFTLESLENCGGILCCGEIIRFAFEKDSVFEISCS